MKRSIVFSMVLGVFMLSASALSKHLIPTDRISRFNGKFDLATLIPTHFGEWSVDQSIVPLQVDPESQAKLSKIYNQTLSRTYTNSSGQKVMLSIAYGGDQSDSMSVHKPEVCYAAQGFEVKKEKSDELSMPFGTIPVKRLFAVSGNRNEPITYWITVGNKAVKPGFDQKLQQLRYGLSGTVPDGMLVRVSTIDTNLTAAYRTQDQFVTALLQSIKIKDRARLVGLFDDHS